MAIKRTGDMMLSGWRLLADHCPICTSALMSKGENMRCPGCDMPVMWDYDLPEEIVREHENKKSPPKAPEIALASAASIAKDTLEDDQLDDIDFPSSFEEMKKDYDQRNKKRDVVSGKLGEMMMTGWTLLGTSCPCDSCAGTPLMSRKGDPMICVSCDKKFEMSRFGELKELPETACPELPKVSTKHIKDELSQSSDPFISWSDAPILNLRSAPSDPSELLSKKLMLGWAMLDEVCGGLCGGSMPLMRDRDGEVTS